MARKNYSDEFRRQAVELYESTPGATVKGIAADLGVERATLRLWLDKLGTGTRTAPDGTRIRSPRDSRTPRMLDTFVPSLPETPEQRLARLEAENAAIASREDQARDRAGDPAPGGQVFRRGDELVSRFQFVPKSSADHTNSTSARPGWTVKRLCALLDVRRSSFYAWLAAAPTRAARTDADTARARRIRAVHDGDRTCGRPRITAELNDGAPPGQRVNHKRIGRVMREHGIVQPLPPHAWAGSRMTVGRGGASSDDHTASRVLIEYAPGDLSTHYVLPAGEDPLPEFYETIKTVNPNVTSVRAMKGYDEVKRWSPSRWTRIGLAWRRAARPKATS